MGCGGEFTVWGEEAGIQGGAAICFDSLEPICHFNLLGIITLHIISPFPNYLCLLIFSFNSNWCLIWLHFKPTPTFIIYQTLYYFNPDPPTHILYIYIYKGLICSVFVTTRRLRTCSDLNHYLKINHSLI